MWTIIIPGIILSLVLSTNAGQRTQCNDGIDKLLETINEDIKSRSPLNKTMKYCDKLSMDGCYTLVRNGDIYGEHIGGPGDCYEQDFNIIIQNLEFTCDVNMAMIMKEINKQATNIGRKKRGFDLDDMDEESAYIVGVWKNICINGKITICKSDESSSKAGNFGLCKPDVENCKIECKGDDDQLTQMCAKGDFLEKIKNMLSSTMQTAAQNEIQKALNNGPSQIAAKFNCEYVA